ncbi:MAG: hypothetical protein RPS47_13850 [Colwellia sp.]
MLTLTIKRKAMQKNVIKQTHYSKKHQKGITATRINYTAQNLSSIKTIKPLNKLLILEVCT